MLDRIRAWLHQSAPSVVSTRRQAQYTAALADQNTKLGPCPACGAENRGIYPTLFHLLEATGDTKREQVPVAAMVCTSCGYVHLFDASILGLATAQRR